MNSPFLWEISVWIGVFTNFFAIVGCTPKKTALPPNWQSLRKALPTQEAVRYHLIWKDADGATGLVQADTLRQAVLRDTVGWLLKGHVEAQWTPAKNSSSNHLRCEEAYLFQTGLLKAYRNVELTTTTGETLQTDELWWERATGRLHAPGWVRITTPTEEVRGWGLESTNNLRSYTLRRIKGRLQSPTL